MRRSTLIFLILSLFWFTPRAYASVVINEIVPKTDPSTYEWVELFNNGSQSVSLDRWKLDHTAGDAKSYIFNASAIIAARGFLTVNGTQTGISFSIQGDTVRLFDQNNTQADSQSYPGILGFNTSMGRTTDGSGVWAMCTTATFNTNNNCPMPSPTPTPLPTNTPTPTPPAPTPTPLPQIITQAPVVKSFGSMLPSPTGGAAVLGVTGKPTPVRPSTPVPTPTPEVLQFMISKTNLAIIFLVIAAAALSYMLYVWLRRRQKRKSRQI